MDNLHDHDQSQYLRFVLAGEEYAFDVLKAREVLELSKITPLPNTLDFMSGVLNLRGSVIPVVDLRKKFHLAQAAQTIDTSIIIVEIQNEAETLVIGTLVDAVKGVMRCENRDLEPPPRFGMQLNANLVKAIAKRDGNFVIILDADRVFSESELWLIRDQSGPAAGAPLSGQTAPAEAAPGPS